MSKFAAATVACHRLPAGRCCIAFAALALLPGMVLAAEVEPALRRSEQIDLRRLGKVSEDERSVLRMEWRAGMAGVEETRSVQDMLDKLRRLEAGIGNVSQLVRNMPAQAPAAATPAPVASAPAPVAAATPVEAKAADSGDYDTRLMVANLVALALVALWWFRRRKPADLPGEALPPPPELAPAAAAKLRKAEAPVSTSAATAPVPAAPALPEPVTMAEPPAMAAVSSASKAPDEAATAPVAKPAAPAEQSTAPATVTPEPAPAETFDADKTMVLDFSLEEADPETVARENARLAALRPASPPEPAPAPVAQKADVEPTLQLAEIMLSMGLEEGAAQALIEYTEANPRHAIYHWLKLLGIYRSRGLQKEFTVTAEKLRMYFNIQAAEWGKPLADGTQTLENFTRIAEHVQKIWSRPEECIGYLSHLLEDNRDGERAGFPQSVAEEILFLVEVQKILAGSAQSL